MSIITNEQRQQIMQTAEFHKEFDKLTKGWKPTIVLTDTKMKDELIQSTPFSQLNMDIATYKEFVQSKPSDMVWGLQHKLCAFALSKQPEYILTWADVIEPYYLCMQEIEKFVTEQQEKAIKSVFLSMKAKHNIIKPL